MRVLLKYINKIYNKIKDTYLNQILNTLNKHMRHTMIYQFYDKERRLKSVKNLDKEKYGVHVRTLKEALNRGFILKKVHRILKNNQKT